MLNPWGVTAPLVTVKWKYFAMGSKGGSSEKSTQSLNLSVFPVMPNRPAREEEVKRFARVPDSFFQRLELDAGGLTLVLEAEEAGVQAVHLLRGIPQAG